MKTFRKVMAYLLLAGVLSFLIVPFLIPESTSGTKTNVEAAGPNAEFLQLAGLSVRVEQVAYQGDCNCKPPLLVLMHGFGASTFSWREVSAPLSQLGDVIAYDRPAFGFTERPTTWSKVNPYGFEGNFEILDSIIAKFGQEREVVLVGHSAGGQLAAEYARLNPSEVDSLILVDPAILTTGGGPDGFVWFYEIPQIKRLGPILVSSIATSGDDLLRESFYDPADLTEEVFTGYHAPLMVIGWEKAFWNFATAPRGNALADNLSALKQPTLLISGENDTVVPTSDTVKLSSLLPNAQLELIPRSAHLPHEEEPELFMAAITKHWQFLVSK
jgi:pimeloyl-ACP methyl ester carboxylesterase